MSISANSDDGGINGGRVSTGVAERVKVVVRCRPMSSTEVDDNYESVVNVDMERKEVEVHRTIGSSGGKVFGFDSVYDFTVSQEEIYEDAFRPLVDSVLEGFNGTIFAYGQTGTGKTYTMEGNRDDEREYGVILNAFRQIFQRVKENSTKQYLIQASYLEIYQEEIRDLLAKSSKSRKELRESPSSGVYVKDLSTYLCSSFNDINDLMTRGSKNRAVGATNMNEHSSRSHAIFIITIETSEEWADGKQHLKAGKLNLVDLAGSERQVKTAATGERFKEATKINLSLSALGNVIAALVDEKSTHIPYRDSKLTRLLQDSLGGNSRTIMVATIGPSSHNYEETMMTLRYASRAKKIKNKPKINEDPKDALLRQYQDEILRLRQELEKTRTHQSKIYRGTLQYKEYKQQQRPSKSRCTTASDPTRFGPEQLQIIEEQRIQELSKLLEPYGLDPSSDAALIMEKLEERRKELMQDKLTVQAEKDKLLQQLDETEALVKNSLEECNRLNERIKWLESKVLTGGKDLLDHTNEQEKLLQRKQEEIANHIDRYQQLKKKLEKEEMTLEDVRLNAETCGAELQEKIYKFNKVNRKYNDLMKETSLSKETNFERLREMECLYRELRKEFVLKKLIVDNFIPVFAQKSISKRVRWNESTDTYELIKTKDFDESDAKLPSIRISMEMPIYSIPPEESTPIKNVHFRNENILQLHPEYPVKKSIPFVPPESDPYVESLIKKTLQEVKQPIFIDCSKSKPIPRRQ